ncbi:MAG: trypsin-like peptidase domain-containing protein [Clostridia bacterium]|nr:trypsin-like peptidase domain-containing protein [Clostridia bacterium]
MNDFNNQDGMNDNYNRNYGDNNGEYYYSYTPNHAQHRQKRAGKYIFVAVMSVVLVALVVFSGVLVGTLTFKTFLQLGQNDISKVESGGADTGDAGIQNSGSASDGDVSIDKSQPVGGGVTSAGQAYNTITEVYNAVSDSVVEITTEIVQNSAFMGQYVSQGAGSGVIVHKSGYIVTNHHVIDGASNVTVTLKDGKTFGATFVGTDASSDIAVIKIDAGDTPLPVAEMGCSEDLVVGEDVIAIGNPLGSLGGTVTEGIISATERHISIDGEDMVLLQTSAAINPGNSGGGLFNMAGQLIGVVNAKASGEDIEGLGFAIPIDTAYPIILDLINYGYVRGIVDHGISAVDVTEQNLFYYYRYGISETGVIVTESQYTDKLTLGDRIISVNGVKISATSDIQRALDGCKVGDVVSIEASRSGKKFTVEITLREQIPDYVDFG